MEIPDLFELICSKAIVVNIPNSVFFIILKKIKDEKLLVSKAHETSAGVIDVENYSFDKGHFVRVKILAN